MKKVVAQPYMFEPDAPESRRNSELTNWGESDAEKRINVGRINGSVPLSSWCTCQQCRTTGIDTDESCKCCRELKEINSKREEADVECITKHAGFEAVCLNPHVLQVAYYQYKQAYGKYDKPQHEQFRFWQQKIAACCVGMWDRSKH